jgi:hypothetical protein
MLIVSTLSSLICSFHQVVDEVRTLSRPRGVDHLSSLIDKGAFSSVLAVMEPTEEAALAVMDVVSSGAEASS